MGDNLTSLRACRLERRAMSENLTLRPRCGRCNDTHGIIGTLHGRPWTFACPDCHERTKER